MRLLVKKPVKVPTQTFGLTICGPRKELEKSKALPEGYDGSTYKPWGNVGNFLTIDPGLGGTGWALWSCETFDELVPPVNSGSVDHPKRDMPWWWHCSEMVERLCCIAQQGEVSNVYVELPQFMEGGKGLAAARDGDLIKLTTIFGAIMGKLTNNQSRSFCPVPIVEWKGNMPKDVFEPRIRAKLPNWKPTTSTTHELDAVGIGLFVKGHL